MAMKRILIILISMLIISIAYGEMSGELVKICSGGKQNYGSCKNRIQELESEITANQNDVQLKLMTAEAMMSFAYFGNSGLHLEREIYLGKAKKLATQALGSKEHRAEALKLLANIEPFYNQLNGYVVQRNYLDEVNDDHNYFALAANTLDRLTIDDIVDMQITHMFDAINSTTVNTYKVSYAFQLYDSLKRRKYDYEADEIRARFINENPEAGIVYFDSVIQELKAQSEAGKEERIRNDFYHYYCNTAFLKLYGAESCRSILAIASEQTLSEEYRSQILGAYRLIDKFGMSVPNDQAQVQELLQKEPG